MRSDPIVARTMHRFVGRRTTWRVVAGLARLGGILAAFVITASFAIAPDLSLDTLQHLAVGHVEDAMLAIGPSQVAVAAPLAATFDRPLQFPPVLTDPAITLTAAETDVSILPGSPTRMWTYNGYFPGPTIRRPTGQTTRVTLINGLPIDAGSLTLHHHGNHSSPENDGHPYFFAIPTAGSRTYTYTGLEDGGNERGATQWYHDHRDMVTGRNVWMGLAGMYILDDPADPQSLPSGEFDLPLMIADRAFDASNQLVYGFTPFGVMGDYILVNGVVQPYFEVGDRRYRFRILNGSNIRDYVLELSNASAMTQIGTESGLLPAPVSRSSIRIGPAERVDLVIDFSGLFGQNIVLRNAAGVGSTAEIMQFRVTRDLDETSSVPASLRPLPSLGTPTVTRTFEFGLTGEELTINGLPFDPNRIDARPVLGTTERWILKNVGPANIQHVAHIHDVDQQLVSRNGVPPTAHERLKETWYLEPGETVEVLLRFTDHTGLYVLHCHLLEHEDRAMMAQFEVVAPAPTATPTPTPTPTLTPTPAGSCPSGQRFTMAAVPNGDGRLRVTLATTTSSVTLSQLHFTTSAQAVGNALVDIPAPPGIARSAAPPPFQVILPSGTTSFTFYVRRATPGQATTLPMTVIDSCGPHETFVGGGPSAF